MPLYEHQQKAIDLAVANPRYGHWLDLGLGKTAIGLHILEHFGKNHRTLIVTKKNLIENAWMADRAKFALQENIVNICGLPKDVRVKWISKSHSHLITSYESFRSDADAFMKADFQMLILDESAALRAPKSQVTKAMLAFAKRVQRAHLFSGLPAPNGEMEYFAQYQIVDPAAFPSNFFAFRNTFFEPEAKQWLNIKGRRQQVVTKWKLRDDKRAEFYGKLRRNARFLKKEDCLDLPEKVFIERYVDLGAEARRVYDELVNDWLTTVGDDVVLAKTKLSELMKCRQVAAGFILNKEDGETHRLTFEEMPAKTQELLDILEETDEPVIVGAQFQAEVQKLSEVLTERGITNRTFYGLTPEKERAAIVDDFQAGKYRVLLGHPRSIGHGLTLTRSSLMVLHSLSYSLDEYYQFVDRIHRIGQKNVCRYIHLMARDTIDKVIYDAVQGKQDVAEAVLKSLKREAVGV